MIAYASRTGTLRNLTALRSAGWGLLVSRAGHWSTEGFLTWAADNGAWRDHQAGQPFAADAFLGFVGWIEAQPIRPQWLVLPDVVAGGLDSLALSRQWLANLRDREFWQGRRLLLAAQDGIEPRHIEGLIGPDLGIFVGGSTQWKLDSLRDWARLARSRAAICHVGRVNSARRIRLCAAAGATSFDGTGPTRFAQRLHLLDIARTQLDIEGWLAEEKTP
jgi:hypothetical protein